MKLTEILNMFNDFELINFDINDVEILHTCA